MPRLVDLLEAAVGTREPQFDAEALRRRAGQRRTRRRALATGVLVVVIAVAAAAIARDDRGPVETVDSPPDASADARDDILVFDDGYDGILAVDLANGRAVRRAVDGQRAGDQPFRSLRVNDHLIVGWGDVYAVPLDGGPARLLGEGVAIPAQEPNAVWLTAYGGVQPATHRLVDPDGNVLLEGRGPEPRSDYSPAAGVPGGLLFQRAAEQHVAWDARSESIVAVIDGTVGPVHGGLVVSRIRAGVLQFTDVTEHTQWTFEHDGDFEIEHAAFSPDGRFLAVPVTDTDGGRHLGVLEVAGRRLVYKSTKPLHTSFPRLAWSEDGTRVFLPDVDGATTRVLAVGIELGTQTTYEFESPTAGQTTWGNFTVVDRTKAGMLLDAVPTEPGDCPAPLVQPSGRTEPCAFTFSVREEPIG